jgi:hypothetical protein
MDKLGLLNYSKRLEKTQNVLKCRILEHFLDWKSITRVNKSKTPFFLSPPAIETPLDFFKFCNAASETGLYTFHLIIFWSIYYFKFSTESTVYKNFEFQFNILYSKLNRDKFVKFGATRVNAGQRGSES